VTLLQAEGFDISGKRLLSGVALQDLTPRAQASLTAESAENAKEVSAGVMVQTQSCLSGFLCVLRVSAVRAVRWRRTPFTAETAEIAEEVSVEVRVQPQSSLSRFLCVLRVSAVSHAFDPRGKQQRTELPSGQRDPGMKHAETRYPSSAGHVADGTCSAYLESTAEARSSQRSPVIRGPWSVTSRATEGGQRITDLFSASSANSAVNKYGCGLEGVMATRVAVIGANGQLGTDLVKAMSDWDLVPLTHSDLDICDFVYTRKVLQDTKPEIVINTAAFNRVDECEEEVSKAFWVNAFAVRNLAKICADLDCVFVHISTDYVFDGRKGSPYTEDDPPNPLSVYGSSKLAGESFARNFCPKHFVVRTCGLYGTAGSQAKGGNFVETMIRLAREGKPIRVVNDQVLTPTYTKDLAQKIKELLQTEAYGLYHITSSGQCSWYEFAGKIFELLGLKPDFGPTTSVEFSAKAKRPAYSVLAHSRLQQLGMDDLRPWLEVLQAYLIEKGYLKG
jgi:dTDP-4-dehydrorhamnose reductase